MKLTRLGNKNAMTIELGKRLILFSYSTPVAYKENGRFYVTDTFHSVTTSRHINLFIGDAKTLPINQKHLDNLGKRIK